MQKCKASRKLVEILSTSIEFNEVNLILHVFIRASNIMTLIDLRLC